MAQLVKNGRHGRRTTAGGSRGLATCRRTETGGVRAGQDRTTGARLQIQGPDSRFRGFQHKKYHRGIRTIPPRRIRPLHGIRGCVGLGNERLAERWHRPRVFHTRAGSKCPTSGRTHHQVLDKIHRVSQGRSRAPPPTQAAWATSNDEPRTRSEAAERSVMPPNDRRSRRTKSEAVERSAKPPNEERRSSNVMLSEGFATPRFSQARP
jgi:hypothetical protein